MTMAMIFPSRRDVSPVEQLRRSPRLVLPRFRLETAALRPESFLLFFFQGKRHHIAEDGHRGPAKWPTRQGGAPTLVDRVWAPWSLWRGFFIIYYKVFRGVSGLLELCRIGL